MNRKPHLSDVSDDEWAFAAPYLTLMTEDAPQREHSLREVFNGLRYVVRTGMQWHMMANDLPPWHTVYQQMQRWQGQCLRGYGARSAYARARDRRACAAAAGGDPEQPYTVVGARERCTRGL